MLHRTNSPATLHGLVLQYLTVLHDPHWLSIDLREQNPLFTRARYTYIPALSSTLSTGGSGVVVLAGTYTTTVACDPFLSQTDSVCAQQAATGSLFSPSDCPFPEENAART